MAQPINIFKKTIKTGADVQQTAPEVNSYGYLDVFSYFIWAVYWKGTEAAVSEIKSLMQQFFNGGYFVPYSDFDRLNKIKNGEDSHLLKYSTGKGKKIKNFSIDGKAYAYTFIVNIEPFVLNNGATDKPAGKIPYSQQYAAAAIQQQQANRPTTTGNAAGAAGTIQQIFSGSNLIIIAAGLILIFILWRRNS